MAAKLPDKLKSADIQRFATRAAQLEKYRPIVTYWCEYYILQQVLGKGLHTADDECIAYATHLMDKLEQSKTANAANDAITDDVAAKAYMENFALETFDRADKAQREDKVNKQTADTFQAAATFMDTLTIWDKLDQELAAKSKFAKFHALRIAKALKAGEDPNATNPKVEEPPATEEDGIDAEMRDLEADAQRQSSVGSAHLQPTVESAPDSVLPSRAESTGPGEPFDPPQVPTFAPGEPSLPPPHDGDVSPIEPSDTANSRQGSVGGGYFPSVPGDQEASAPSGPDLLTQPAVLQPPSAPSPGEFYQAAHAPQPPTPSFAPDRPGRPPPEQMSAQPPAQPTPSFLPPPPSQVGYTQPTPAAQAPPPAPVPPSMPAPPVRGYRTDDESVIDAQKHAKWAISALNFEDVPTAVSELMLALRSLGAT